MSMDLATDPRGHFDGLFAASEDPWHFKQRWYEQRKRAMTLACLPRARYASGYEPGCANGELSAALAGRCDRLLISDDVLSEVIQGYRLADGEAVFDAITRLTRKRGIIIGLVQNGHGTLKPKYVSEMVRTLRESNLLPKGVK